MTHLHAIVVPLQTVVPHLTKFLTKSHRVIYKRKKKQKISTKRKETKGKDKNTIIKEKKKIANAKFKLLNKKKVI